MSKIRNIVFDFGGVLVDWNPRYLYRQVFADEAEMEHFLTKICSPEWNFQFDGGKSFADGVAELQQQFPEYRDAIQLYKDRWSEMLHAALPESVELLRRLKAQGFHLYGLTNWSAETIGIAYARFDFFKLFEGIVVSGAERVCKPDPRIFQILLDRYHLVADESIFIDDSPANAAAATALGLHGIRFLSASQSESEIRQIVG